MGKGHKLCWSGGADGGIGFFNGRSGRGNGGRDRGRRGGRGIGRGDRSKVPETGARCALAGEDDVIIVLDGDGGGVKGNATPGIAELADGHKGLGV